MARGLTIGWATQTCLGAGVQGAAGGSSGAVRLAGTGPAADSCSHRAGPNPGGDPHRHPVACCLYLPKGTCSTSRQIHLGLMAAKDVVGATGCARGSGLC